MRKGQKLNLDRDLDILFDYRLEKMSMNDISKKYNLTLARVSQIIKGFLEEKSIFKYVTPERLKINKIIKENKYYNYLSNL